ncbi:MAG TPA: hypothetical protein VKT49_17875 [Bryobacteraceae bacterium]|nr:hypothetical protein [Bryobacteraceae bacterium]
MEIIDTAVTEELGDRPSWSNPPPPKLEEEELDILAFELWQRASRQDAAAEEACADEDIVVGCHASCL